MFNEKSSPESNLQFDDLLELAKSGPTPATQKAVRREYEVQLDSNIKAGLCKKRTKYAMAFLPTRLIMLRLLTRQDYFTPVHFRDTRLNKNKTTRQDFLSNTSSYFDVYNMLSDDLSKYIFLNLLATRMTINFEYLKNAYTATKQYPPYLDPILNLQPGEIMVDCGAYTGDTLDEFISAGIIPGRYYGFEPDNNSFNKLSQQVKKYETAGVECILWKAGCYNKSGSLRFESNLSVFSRVSEDGGDSIDVVSLDAVIKGSVTFIKMDIEGSERKALEGAERIIKTYKPKLAICIYHRLDDYRVLPLLIKKLCKDYKNFYIRHTTLTISETILYVS